MIIDVETITKVTALLVAVSALLSAVTTLISAFQRTLGASRSFRLRVLRPFFIFFLALAVLLIPNGLFLEFMMRQAAIYYWVAGNQDLNISDDMAFFKFVLWQTVPVSLYSYLWAALIYPRFLRWLRRTKEDGGQPPIKPENYESGSPLTKQEASANKGRQRAQQQTPVTARKKR